MQLGTLQHFRRDYRTALEWGEPYSKFSFGEEYRRKYGRKSHFTAPLVRNRKTQFLTVYLRPTLKIFLFPLTQPSFTGMGRSMWKIIFLTSQIGYSFNLIIYSKACLKRPLRKKTKLFVFSRPIIPKCRSKLLQKEHSAILSTCI